MYNKLIDSIIFDLAVQNKKLSKNSITLYVYATLNDYCSTKNDFKICFDKFTCKKVSICDFKINYNSVRFIAFWNAVLYDFHQKFEPETILKENCCITCTLGFNHYWLELVINIAYDFLKFLSGHKNCIQINRKNSTRNNFRDFYDFRQKLNFKRS